MQIQPLILSSKLGLENDCVQVHDTEPVLNPGIAYCLVRRFLLIKRVQDELVHFVSKVIKAFHLLVITVVEVEVATQLVRSVHFHNPLGSH